MCSKTGLYLKRIVLDSQLQQIYKYSTTFTIHDVKLYYVYTKTNWDMHKNTVHTVRVCAATFSLRGVFTDFTLPGGLFDAKLSKSKLLTLFLPFHVVNI